MKISPKYFLIGSLFGLGLLYGLLQNLPDGKLHVYFCDVGQGDAIYIRFPNNSDMLVDGGPDTKVLSCLGLFMPFYDRSIDLVVLTHPQQDHMQGLIGVIDRYTINYFVTVPVENKTEGYISLKNLLKSKKIPIKYLTRGDEIKMREVKLTVLWPQKKWMTDSLNSKDTENKLITNSVQNIQTELLGLETTNDLNSYSLYMHLVYQDFDVLFTGDGDERVQALLGSLNYFSDLPDVEVLKVPHHGSKTGMTNAFLEEVKPELAIIEVGKNSYGHPSEQALKSLERYGMIMRTDINGTIEVISNGKTWTFLEK